MLIRLLRTVVAEYVEKKERAQQNEMQNKLNTISEKYYTILFSNELILLMATSLIIQCSIH